MGKSYIISSNDNNYINSKIKEIFDNLEIDQKSICDDIKIIKLEKEKSNIGIERMQELRIWSKSKPYKYKNKIALIYDADKLTLQAQNNILKLLEEPNIKNTYILITTNYTKLLQTIISRCFLLISNNKYNDNFDINTYLKSNSLEKIIFCNENINNDNIDDFLISLLLHFQKEIREGIDSRKNISIVNQTKKYLNSNISLKHALEYLNINIESV